MACAAFAAIPARSSAATTTVKLPYAKGQSFIVTQGYYSAPTHIKKDAYALDLTQNGCDAYGKAVVAAASGTVMFLGQEGYNGGYGTELIVDHGGNIVSRYAHLVPGSITVLRRGDAVRRGQTIGLVGDTGLVAGLACAAHPGTHLHFAMDAVDPDGTFVAYDPEPISGNSGMTEGKWYLSDNNDDADVVSAPLSAAPFPAAPDIQPPAMPGEVLGAYAIATTTDIAIGTSTVAFVASSAIVSTINTGPSSAIPSGGVAVISGSVTSSAPLLLPLSSQLSSSAPPDESTTSTAETDPSSAATSSVPAGSGSGPMATGTLFAQLDDGANSSPSWYDDNWFELGSGFSGTLNTLTLEGKVSDVNYFASRISLQEFKDKTYSVLVREFPISDNAPFTPVMASATYAGLSISLKPYFYYRLATDQDYQNRSVILAGTASTTAGVVMWNNFVYGTGRVESTSTFFPFIKMDGIFATSTLTPPMLTALANLKEDFDQLGMQLSLSWSTSTDPDWPADPLHYQMNWSTSTSLSDAGWADPGSIPLEAGNTYLVGIRAADNYGDISPAATATWNFPAGFVPYLLGPEMGYASQYFTVPATSTLGSIELFTANIQTSARYMESVGCSLQLFDEQNLSSLGVTPADNGFGGYGCAGNLAFSFASSSLMLYPDHRYHWVFTATTGNPSTGASVQFYGTATDTAGGTFSNPALVNAKFAVRGDSGVLFSN